MCEAGGGVGGGGGSKIANTYSGASKLTCITCHETSIIRKTTKTRALMGEE